MKKRRLRTLSLIHIGFSLLLAGEGHAFWLQVNEDGFGRLEINSTWDMVAFNHELYVGTGLPGRIYRTGAVPSSITGHFQWTAVRLPSRIGDGLTRYEVNHVSDLEVLEASAGSWLYAATSGVDQDGSLRSVVLRSIDGVAWELTGEVRDLHPRVDTAEMAVGEVATMAVFDGYLYISAGDVQRFFLQHSMEESKNAMRVLRTDGDEWETVVDVSEGDVELGPDDTYFGVFRSFNGYLYAGTAGFNEAPGDRTAEVWRTENGRDWRKVADLYSPTMAETKSMEVFDGYLYVGTKNHPATLEDAVGPELWRTSDGTRWEKVPLNGQFNIRRLHIDSLRAYEGYLYAGVGGGGPPGSVATLYRSVDGLTWEDVTPNALGQDEENYLVSSVVVIGGTLVVGTGFNVASGTEIWQYDPNRMGVPHPEIEQPPRRLPDSSDLGAKNLYLVDCQPGPMFLGKFCDPRVNPEYDRFLIVDLANDDAEVFSKKQLELRPDDGPLFAAAPAMWDGKRIFVASAPFANTKETGTGSILFFDEQGGLITRLEGRSRGEHLGLDMDVRDSEIVAVSSQRAIRISSGKVIQEIPIAAELRADRGARIAFTDDVDGDRRPDVLLGTPYANAGGLAEAGQIRVIGSKTGEVIDTLYGRHRGQRLGAVLQVISQDPPLGGQ